LQSGSGKIGLAKASTMSTAAQEQPSMIERMERALLLLAYFIELDGDIHVPMYEKFEAELEELKKKEDTKDRARRLLLAYKRFRLVGLVPHQAVDEAIGRFCCHKTILKLWRSE
jgi:hypothetical protein